MDIGFLFFDLINFGVSLLKTTIFTFLGYDISLWNCLIGGIIIYLIFYFIFKVGE